MANTGSAISAANILNYGEIVWIIREGQIKNFLYDPEVANWVKSPLRPAVAQSPSGFNAGSVQVSNTEIIRLPEMSIRKVTLKSRSTNTGAMYIGGNGVSNVSGYELSPGESVVVEIDNLEKIYVIGMENLGRLDYMYETVAQI
jgi:hypothetical protein